MLEISPNMLLFGFQTFIVLFASSIFFRLESRFDKRFVKKEDMPTKECYEEFETKTMAERKEVHVLEKISDLGKKTDKIETGITSIQKDIKELIRKKS